MSPIASFPAGFSPTELKSVATAQTGLSDFGEGFDDLMQSYLQSVLEESGLTDSGRDILLQDTVRLLMNRLLHQEGLRRHPEILDEDVADPVVIIGNPRTGTTKLQRMLGASTWHQTLPLWKVLFPFPLPTAATEAERLAMARGFQQQITEHFPGFMAAHPMVADEPEEDSLFMQMSFDFISGLSWFYPAPSYRRMLAGRSQVPAYRYLRSLLQHMQWLDGGRRNRTWVLKNPLHTGHIAELAQIFPKATLVHCHRDPAVTVPSIARLTELIRLSRGLHPDPYELGRFFLAELSANWRDNLVQRRQLPPTVTVLDVPFRDIVEDGTAVAKRIYAARGEEPLPEALAAMQRWERSNPADRHGKHEYSLQRYGLDTAQVRTAFADYHAAFRALET